MLELAGFYGWTLDYIRSLSMREIDFAREHIKTVNNQGGK